MKKNNKIDRKNKLLLFNKYTWLFIGLYFLLSVGVTYAYLAFQVEENSVITGNVVAIDAEVDVELVVGSYEEMVPLADDALSNALNGVGSTNGACVDRVGNLSCQVYKITLINKGSRLRHIDGTIELYAKDEEGNVYSNLKWRELSNTTTVKSDSVANSMRKSKLVTDLTIESKETMVWYIAVYIGEANYDQKNVDTGVFEGTVTFSSNNGENNCGSSSLLNEYGFYYGEKYSTTIDGVSGSYVFYEDGSVDQYVNGEMEHAPAGTVSYEIGKIIADGIEFDISSDGTVITVSNDDLTINFVLDVPVLNEYGFYYGKKYSAIIDGESLAYVFYEDGSVDLYLNGVFDQHTPSGAASYEEGVINLGREIGYISSDGTKIEFPDDGITLTYNSSGLNEYGFYYDKKYNVKMGEFSGAFVFHEDGSVDGYENGVFGTTFPSGAASYEEGILRLNDGDEVLVGYISSDGTIIAFPDAGFSMFLEDDFECSQDSFDGSILDTDIVVGETYYVSTPYDRWDGIITAKLKFNENGTVDHDFLVYNTNLYDETVQVKYKDNSLVMTLSSLGNCQFSVSNEGVLLNGSCSGEVADMFKGVNFILGDEFKVDGDYTYNWVGDGWGVRVNETKSSYDPIRTELDGFPITVLKDTFHDNTSLVTAPAIPNTVKDMRSTFEGCTNLVSAPVIPSSVTNMEKTFFECSSLEGNVEINATNLINFDYAFNYTVKPIVITGTISNDLKSQLAATASNGNVTYR